MRNRYDDIPFVWNEYRLSPGSAISCESFESVNSHVKNQLHHHNNGHFNTGMDDNCLSSALYNLYLLRLR